MTKKVAVHIRYLRRYKKKKNCHLKKTTMATATKMIIITSNEDIIRQFSSQKIKDTHIIDLDTDKQMSSIGSDNNNIINLAFLAELSKPVCILFRIKFFSNFRIFVFYFCRIQIMIKFINVHLIHRIRINQNLLKYQKNGLI